jgi:competence protein ComEA
MGNGEDSLSDSDIKSTDNLFDMTNENPSLDVSPDVSKEKIEEEVFIHICGEVKRPGVYQFTYEPRLIEVIKSAGGLTKKAADDSINQAQTVSDGMQIVIYNKKQVKKEKTGSNSPSHEKEGENTNDLININTAGKEELMNLTGIGESKAAAIIQYREENGSFHVKEDIMKISGIKEATYELLKDMIMI